MLIRCCVREIFGFHRQFSQNCQSQEGSGNQRYSTPKTIEQVQSLNGKIAALSRFISRAAYECISFFNPIRRGKGNSEWTQECEDALQALVVERHPILSKPLDHEDLYIYLDVSVCAISTTLLCKQNRIHRQLYHVSKQLAVERNYLKLEKLAY